MAIHSSTIAWKIPWTEEPGRLQSMGSQRVRHNWATSLSLSLSYLSKERMLVLIRVDSHQLINKLLSPLSTHKCCCCCLVAKSCLSLCDPIDHSPPGSSVHGISRARILEWVAISSSGGLPRSGIEPTSPSLAGRFFTTEPSGKHKCCMY